MGSSERSCYEWIEELPFDLRPLATILNQPQSELTTRTDALVKEWPVGIRNGLLEDCVERGYDGLFFARVCSLIGYHELSAWLKVWFEQKGLILLENSNIQVHLKHSNLKGTFSDAGCHEVAQQVLCGLPNGAVLDDLSVEKVRRISCLGFNLHDHGAIAEVNAWGRLRYAVTGRYVAGKHPEARGIMVPTRNDSRVIYWFTENSFNNAGVRNFFLQPDTNFTVGIALSALSRHLHGDIPAEAHLLSKNELLRSMPD